MMGMTSWCGNTRIDLRMLLTSALTTPATDASALAPAAITSAPATRNAKSTRGFFVNVMTSASKHGSLLTNGASATRSGAANCRSASSSVSGMPATPTSSSSLRSDAHLISRTASRLAVLGTAPCRAHAAPPCRA